MILSMFFIIIGFALLIVSADILVDGSSGIAKKFHIPEIIIGLTIVSIGTSMPELFVSITSALEGHQDMAIGNIIGSNLSNLLLILGLSAIIKPVVFQKETRFYEIPMCLFFTIIFMIFCNSQNSISRIEAIILLILFCVFLGYTIFMGKKESKDNLTESEVKSEGKENKKMIPFIVITTIIIISIIILGYLWITSPM